MKKITNIMGLATLGLLLASGAFAANKTATTPETKPAATTSSTAPKATTTTSANNAQMGGPVNSSHTSTQMGGPVNSAPAANAQAH